MPQNVDIAKFISEYEHGVDKFEEWIVDVTKQVVNKTVRRKSSDTILRM